MSDDSSKQRDRNRPQTGTASASMLGDENYILLTTYRRNGQPVSTPVWSVPLGEGRFGFYTSSGSGKAKRLAHTQRVVVQPCDMRGRVRAGTEPVEAEARMVTGSELHTIRDLIVAKYGFMTKITRVAEALHNWTKGKRIPYGDVGVAISIPR